MNSIARMLMIALFGLSLWTQPSNANFFEWIGDLRGSEVDAESCVSLLRRRIYNPTDHVTERMTEEFPLSARMEATLLNLSEQQLDRIFDRFDRSTLSQAASLMMSGQVSVDPSVRGFIDDLLRFANRYPRALWPNENANRREAIFNAINQEREREIRFSELEGPFNSPYPNMIKGIRETDHALIEVIEGRGRSQGSAFRTYFFPLYHRALSIGGATDFILKEFAVVEDVDKIIEHALTQDWAEALTDGERRLLNESIEDTPVQLSSLQSLGAYIFGPDVVRGQAIDPMNFDMYAIATNVEYSQLDSARTSSRMGAVRDIDRLADMLEARGVSEAEFGPDHMTDRGLQTRQDIREWNREHLARQYREALQLKPGVWYRDRWTELVCRTVTSGSGDNKTTRTECKTETRTATRYPTYANIINDDYYVRGTATGLQQIKQEAAGIRQREWRLKQPAREANEWFQQLPDKFAQVKRGEMRAEALIAEIDQKITVLSRHREQAIEYTGWLDRSNAERLITNQYAHDSVEHFAARNQTLAARYTNLVRQLKLIREIVDRDLSGMAPHYNLPDRTVQYLSLRAKYLWARGTQIGVPATLMIGGVAWSMSDPSSFGMFMDMLSENIFQPIGELIPSMSDIQEMYNSAIRSEEF